MSCTYPHISRHVKMNRCSDISQISGGNMFQKYIDSQYRRPRGLVGRWIGRKMVQQHQPENLWTINLLDIKPADQILEVGFGAGFAIQDIAKHLDNGQVTGVDFSAAMVRAAGRRSADAIRAGKVKLIEG